MNTKYLIELAHQDGFKQKCLTINHQLLEKDENERKCKKKTLVIPNDEEIEDLLALMILKFLEKESGMKFKDDKGESITERLENEQIKNNNFERP